MDRKSWIYDLETLAGCFTITSYNIDTHEIFQSVLHKDRFEFHELIDHLNECRAQIGFNNNNFDYPIIHFILKNQYNWGHLSKSQVITEIYNEAQRIINDQNPFGTQIPLKEVKIPQLDLFRLWHFNNKARMQSLKGLLLSTKVYRLYSFNPSIWQTVVVDTKGTTLFDTQDLHGDFETILKLPSLNIQTA